MRLAAIALALVLVVLLALACGTDAVGVDACRQIEEARCAKAPGCPGISLGQPIHRGSPATDVDACQRYYDDACLHGLVNASDPGAPAVNECVAAINANPTNCDVIEHPEHAQACAWLIPPAPVVVADAAAEGATDASADAPSE